MSADIKNNIVYPFPSFHVDWSETRVTICQRMWIADEILHGRAKPAALWLLYKRFNLDRKLLTLMFLAFGSLLPFHRPRAPECGLAPDERSPLFFFSINQLQGQVNFCCLDIPRCAKTLF
jgi:hypothetical protein